MLHELVMCLLGNVGGLFQLKVENNVKKIKLVENLEFIHPAEVEICNKLAELGNYFRQMNQFMDDYSFGKSFENKPLKYGLYLTTFCDALNVVVITPYRLTISNLEKSLLKDHHLNVTFIQTHLEHHYILFNSICNLLNEIESKKLYGCQIVDIVYKYTISGNYVIKETFNRILKIVLEVMYKNLRDWMIYGTLNDKYNEFYISYDANKNESINKTAANNNDDEDAGIVTNELDEFYLDTRFSSNYSQFTLMSSRLPSFINLKIANHILFTGELLQLFQAKFLNEIYSSGGTDSISFKLAQNLSINKVQYVSEIDKTLKTELDLMNQDLNVFSKEIYEISKKEFSIIKFEELITRIRNHVSENVWSLIVEKYNLFSELGKLKEMFLIGRGELFATFLESSKELLDKQIDVNFEYNINYFFQKSISRMLLDDEQWLTKFRIIVSDLNPLKKTNQDGWSRIGLSYKVEWPFHSLITQKVLKKYNQIFNYLFSIRRVQSELNQCFMIQMRLNSLDKEKKYQINPKVWLTRNHMSFLIDNLQFYLQADVLETQFMDLLNNIRMSKDFEQIRYAHDTFLTKIQAQAFLLNKIVSNCLSEIMETCLTFSLLVNTFWDSSHVKKEFPYDKIEVLIKSFQNQTHLLYKTFRTLEKRQLGSHLEQLLTRINFNNYLAEHDGF